MASAPVRRVEECAMLLNIDLPERHAMLHDKSCSHLPRPVSTRYKHVGSVGGDGGWFRIASKASAEAGYIYMYSLMEEQPLALAMQEELIAQVSAGGVPPVVRRGRAGRRRAVGGACLA